MFISIAQIERSLFNLKDLHPFFGMSFLAFKKAKLPVGRVHPFVFSQLAVDILNLYYKPSQNYAGFYNPFHTSKPKERWVKPRYYDTSMQRWTFDTFGDALIHDKGSQDCGWRTDYINALKRHLEGHLVPAFDLGVWLFRNIDWARANVDQQIVDRLLKEFSINSEEKNSLFDTTLPSLPSGWLKRSPLTEIELLNLIGRPPGSRPEEGAALRLLELHEVGPATNFSYEPGDRLNIITGDNSLGKTFILECVWWALTGEWLDQQAYPRRDVPKDVPRIGFSVGTGSRQLKPTTVKYNWDRRSWTKPTKREALPGLVVYARYDGSFAVWDPARLPSESTNKIEVFMPLNKVWEGLTEEGQGGRLVHICNGLLRDWVSWQTGGDRYAEHYKALVACLEGLSPQGVERLKPGQPIRLPGDSRDSPTLQMPYGEVPVLRASAGVQRIIALAYVLVWAWHEHVNNSNAIRRAPQKSLVLIVDEVEAHLHPRWQRVIVPALMNTIAEVAKNVSPQIHLATHSPLVIMSAELLFDEDCDDLLHLRLNEERDEVLLDNVPFIKRGRPDLWLISEIFGFAQPRSLPAEDAIEAAKALLLADEVSGEEINTVNAELIRYLTPDDDFWPRWLYFAEQHGADK